jgi:hypothetical protein
MKGYYKVISLQIFPYDILVSINQTDKEVLKVLKNFGVSKSACAGMLNIPKGTNARYTMTDANHSIIRFKHLDDKIKMIGSVVHECFHAAHFILDRAGLKFDLDHSDEAFAYTTQYLTVEILRWLEDEVYINKVTSRKNN